MQLTGRMRTVLAQFIAAALAATLAAPVRAQARAELPRASVSMGQPLRWQPYAAALALANRNGEGQAASLLVGVHRSVTSPVTGLIGGAAELYGNASGAFPGVGTRVMATSKLVALAAGLDWHLSRGRVDLALSYQSAVRRGGLLGHGSLLRIDWLPTRGRMLGVGITAPLLQPYAGRTRPVRTSVALPGAGTYDADAGDSLSPAAESALQRAAHAASLVRASGSLYSPSDARRIAGGPGAAAAAREYLTSLARAFGAAAGDSMAGERLAQRAREGLLRDVLLPFNALFGQVKDNDDIAPLAATAQSSFARVLRDSSGVNVARHGAILRVHARWLAIVDGVHDDLSAQWKDSRVLWLPLQLALAPEQYDEQTEVDSLIARVVGRPFTDQNALALLRSSDLPLEIARSIYTARDYHVLWMHDFTGTRTKTNTVDNLGYSMVADVYLPALTAAVQRYDRTGRMPTYTIVLDQFWYEPREGRLWMTMLENPLSASMRLPGDNADRERHLRARQEALRAAVAGSRRLQADAQGNGGEAWLRRIVKVNVSIANPSDFSFRSHHIIPALPFTPDNMVRDHRKIAFHDLTEADPYRGGMLLMGVGIGEHYASDTWEDRGYRIRGPATLEVRDALVRFLKQNGFGDDDIPEPLRAVKSAATVERAMNRGDYVGRALQVHNDVGFGAKRASAARAMLYNLAQAGSVVIVPDPLWLSAEWAAMLAGAASRGARVHVIAPAVENAPSPHPPLLALSHDVMLRLVELSTELGSALKREGGELRVGLFAARAHVDDAAGRRREVREGLQRAPWIRDLIPFDARTLAVLDRADAQVASDGNDATDFARDERPRAPQLHMKTQLIARPGAIAAFVRQPGWEDVLASTMVVQSQRTASFADQLGFTTPEVDSSAARGADALLRGYERAVSEAERKRVSFYYTIGTQNHDPRGMMLDGEATMLVSGIPAAAGLVDLYSLMARSTWVRSQAELERLLPPRSEWLRWLAHLIRPAM